MCAKRFDFSVLFGATPAPEPERQTEPWLKGVHPTQAEWKKTRTPRNSLGRSGDYRLELWPETNVKVLPGP